MWQVLLTRIAGLTRIHAQRDSVSFTAIPASPAAMPRFTGLWIFTLCILGLYSSLARAEDEPCTIWDGDTYYDLNPLKSK